MLRPFIPARGLLPPAPRAAASRTADPRPSAPPHTGLRSTASERAAPPGGTRGCEGCLLAEPPSPLSAPRTITERLAAGSPVSPDSAGPRPNPGVLEPTGLTPRGPGAQVSVRPGGGVFAPKCLHLGGPGSQEFPAPSCPLQGYSRQEVGPRAQVSASARGPPRLCSEGAGRLRAEAHRGEAGGGSRRRSILCGSPVITPGGCGTESRREHFAGRWYTLCLRRGNRPLKKKKKKTYWMGMCFP